MVVEDSFYHTRRVECRLVQPLVPRPPQDGDGTTASETLPSVCNPPAYGS